jgi:RNA polymerase sigma-70 factor (ECF subfamily)
VSCALTTGYDLIFGRNAAATAASADGPVAIIEPMSFDQLPDEELVARARAVSDARDRDDCINELFRRNYARVARWCLRFTADREAAADLAQEIFAKVYKNLDSFQGQSKFSTWLFSIARNHSLNAVRANQRQATELRAEVEDDFLFTIPDAGANPYTAAEQQSSAKLATELLNRALDDTEKVVFTLHYGEDVPLDAITRLLGLENRSGAKAFIVSAKRKLTRMIEQEKTGRQQAGTRGGSDARS